MPFVSPLGMVELLIPVGQSCVVASFGAGTAKVYTGVARPSGNLPHGYNAPVNVSGQFSIGPVAAITAIKIEASPACQSEYAVGVNPQLSAPNASSMPTITMGAGQRVIFSAADALTAKSGGGQSGATALSADINRVTGVAAANDSVLLPASAAGMQVTATNAHATNSMNVFPALGEAINALGNNAAFAVAAGKTAVFTCAVGGKWSSVLSA